MTPEQRQELDEMAEDNPYLRFALAEIDRLAGIVAKLPTKEAVEQAVASIQSSIDSHESWAAYRRKQGKDNPEYGDLEHHETCLAEYAQVMIVLRSIHAAASAAKEQENG